ncbi:MAG: TonB-dependent receptor [Verrucomicrobiota bacterium]
MLGHLRAFPADPVKLADISLDELVTLKLDTVYGASKHEQRLDEAPSAVTVITADEITRFGYRTLSDIIQDVRGMSISSDRIYPYIGARGVNRPGDFGGRILMAINGHRINEPIYGQSFNGTEFPLDVDLIERVEVIRGPGSSLYGDNAFFSVINVITRKPGDFHGGEIAASVGTFDSYSGRLSYGNTLTNGVSFLLSGTWFQSEGNDELSYPEFASVHGGKPGLMDGQRAPSTWATVSWRDLSFEAAYVDRRKEVPTAVYGTLFGQDPAWEDDKRGFAGVKFEHAFESDWRLMARAYYEGYESALESVYDGAMFGLPGTRVEERRGGAARWLSGEIQASKEIFDRHLLTFGSDVRHDLEVSQDSRFIDPPIETSHVDSPQDNVGLFGQDEFTLTHWLRLNVGLRYDQLDDFGDSLNPRAALILTPLSRSTLTLIYGQAFRAPNAFEANGYYPGTLVVNPDLDPETIRSYEAVWEQRLDDHWQVTGDVFYNDLSDLIILSYDNDLSMFSYRNASQADARGAEFEVRGHWNGGILARANYSFVEAYEETAAGGRQRLVNSPKHMGKLGLSVPVWERTVFASLDARLMSARDTVRGGSVPGFAALDLTVLAREFVPGLTASLSVYNFTDQRPKEPAAPVYVQEAIEQDGRTVRFKLTYRF